MLSLFGKPSGKFCDGLSRRSFLTIGSLGIAGATLPRLLQAEDRAGTGRSHKAIINALLPGGPPHQDMFDLKPEAPSDIRGEFKPISTNVPGIQICEEFPRMARMMDKFTIIRSMIDSQGAHDLYQCVTGHPRNTRGFAGGIPSTGAWVSSVQGQSDTGVPAHLSLMYPTGHAQWGDPGEGGFLGKAHAPFRLVAGKGQQSSTESASNMVLNDLSLERLQDRHALRKSFDLFRQKVERTASLGGYGEFEEKALGILSSSALSDALDLSREDPKCIERYGKPDPEWRADGAPKMTTNFLLARRLVEAGARYVSLNFSRWDWHSGNFKRGREDMPLLDHALSSLVEDLHERGLDRASAWFAGENSEGLPRSMPREEGIIGPRRTFASWPVEACNGQVIGSTDKQAAEPADDRPVRFKEVFSTLFHQMGISPTHDRAFDLQGRPHYPVDPQAKPIAELI